MEIRNPSAGFFQKAYTRRTFRGIPHISIIDDDDRRRQALEAGAVAFLRKPFYEEELLNAINVALKDS
jgi:CheY-like chemotaxis protein